MVHFHQRHGFCSNCGARSQMAQGGWKRECPSCKTETFPRTDPVVIMLVTDGDRCLLGRQKQFLKGMWSCLAGFVEPAETIEDAVEREIREEAGIECTDVKYYKAQPWPYPYSLMIGCTARAATTDINVDRTELEDARWFTREEVLQMFSDTHPEGYRARTASRSPTTFWASGRSGPNRAPPALRGNRGTGTQVVRFPVSLKARGRLRMTTTRRQPDECHENPVHRHAGARSDLPHQRAAAAAAKKSAPSIQRDRRRQCAECRDRHRASRRPGAAFGTRWATRPRRPHIIFEQLSEEGIERT